MKTNNKCKLKLEQPEKTEDRSIQIVVFLKAMAHYIIQCSSKGTSFV